MRLWWFLRRCAISDHGGLWRSHSRPAALCHFLCSNFLFLSRGHDPYCQSSAPAIEWPRQASPEDTRSAAGLAREGGWIKGIGGWRVYLSLSPNQRPPVCMCCVDWFSSQTVWFIRALADASVVAPTSAAPYLNEISSFFYLHVKSLFDTKIKCLSLLRLKSTLGWVCIPMRQNWNLKQTAIWFLLH